MSACSHAYTSSAMSNSTQNDTGTCPACTASQSQIQTAEDFDLVSVSSTLQDNVSVRYRCTVCETHITAEYTLSSVTTNSTVE